MTHFQDLLVRKFSAQPLAEEQGKIESTMKGELPTIVVAGIIHKGDTILITQRLPSGHLPSMWEFPGGKLEPGETTEDALIRECQEECAIDIRVDGIFDVVFHRYPTKNVLLLFYACTHLQGEVQHLGVRDHAWVKRDQLRGYAFPEADERILERLITQA